MQNHDQIFLTPWRELRSIQQAEALRKEVDLALRTTCRVDRAQTMNEQAMHILEIVTQHLNSGPDARIICCVQGGYKAPVYGPKDLPKMKADGTGLRIGKHYVFAYQIKLARLNKA